MAGQIQGEHTILMWSIRHAGCLRNLHHAAPHWTNAIGACRRQQRSERAVEEFGEKAYVDDQRATHGEAMVVWLGLVVRAHRAYIGTPGGVVRAWTITVRAGQVEVRWRTGLQGYYAIA